MIYLFYRNNHISAPRPAVFCRNCILGRIVPAYRPSRRRWNLGIVVAFRNDTSEFCLTFQHNVQEWLRLENAPYEAYTGFYRQRKQQLHPMKRTMTHDDFWHSDDLSWTTNRKYQRGHLLNSSPCIPVAIDVTSKPVNICSAPQVLPDMHSLSSVSTLVMETKASNQHKSAPRHWTDAEDKKLIYAVTQSHLPLKWARIASLVSNRTGKQCRERYFNHLHTKVKMTEWSPLEDALICRLYKSIGSKWVEISKFIPGRSDNNCKNRWHYLRRHMEKYVSSLPPSKEIDGPLTLVSPIKAQILKLSRKTVNAPDEMNKAITRALVHMAETQAPVVSPMPECHFTFGPFLHPKEFVICARCSLMVSSAQTGPICQKTKWCWACTTTPAVLTDDFLRLEHQIRTGPRRVSLGEEEKFVNRK